MESQTCIRVLADPVQIKECRGKLRASEEACNQLSNVLSLAGNDVRLKILYLLSEEKELCPCDLSDILGISIPAVSQHLRKLKDGNIIGFRKAGQTIYYSLKSNQIRILKPFFKFINENSNSIKV
jgi:DNA-binding transcriptional ArsR family regulator